MNEIVKECIWLVVADLVLVAIALWVFESDAARFAVFAGMCGFTVPTVFRLVNSYRRQKSRDNRT